MNSRLRILPVCTNHMSEQPAFVQLQYVGHNNSRPPTAQNPIILHSTGQRFRNAVLQNNRSSGLENCNINSVRKEIMQMDKDKDIL